MQSSGRARNPNAAPLERDTRDNYIVRACTVEMHMDISQEPFFCENLQETLPKSSKTPRHRLCASLRGRNAHHGHLTRASLCENYRDQSVYPDLTPAFNPYRKKVWGHCVGKKVFQTASQVFGGFRTTWGYYAKTPAECLERVVWWMKSTETSWLQKVCKAFETMSFSYLLLISTQSTTSSWTFEDLWQHWHFLLDGTFFGRRVQPPQQQRQPHPQRRTRPRAEIPASFRETVSALTNWHSLETFEGDHFDGPARHHSCAVGDLFLTTVDALPDHCGCPFWNAFLILGWGRVFGLSRCFSFSLQVGSRNDDVVGRG